MNAPVSSSIEDETGAIETILIKRKASHVPAESGSSPVMMFTSFAPAGPPGMAWHHPKAVNFDYLNLADWVRVVQALENAKFELYFAHRNYVIGSMGEEARRKAKEKKGLPPEEAGMEWRSFRSLPRGDLGGILKPAEK